VTSGESTPDGYLRLTGRAKESAGRPGLGTDPAAIEAVATEALARRLGGFFSSGPPDDDVLPTKTTRSEILAAARSS
jgi:hypothetical protein